MSSWPWAATRLRTIRSASASSWRRSATATRSWCRVDPRFNRTAAVADAFVQIRAGTDIAFLGGLIHYALSQQPVPRRVRARCSPTRRSCSRTATRFDADERRVLGLGRGAEGLHRHVELGLRARRARLREGRSDAAASALGVPGDEDVLRALHAGDGRRHLRLQRRRTSTRPPSSSPPPTRRIAPARSCTRWAGRITATRCS